MADLLEMHRQVHSIVQYTLEASVAKGTSPATLQEGLSCITSQACEAPPSNVPFYWDCDLPLMLL